MDKKLYFVYRFHDVEFTPTSGAYIFDCVKCYNEIELKHHHQVEIDANGAITVTPMVICPTCGHTIWIDGSLGIDMRREKCEPKEEAISKSKPILGWFNWCKKKFASGAS